MISAPEGAYRYHHCSVTGGLPTLSVLPSQQQQSILPATVRANGAKMNPTELAHFVAHASIVRSNPLPEKVCTSAKRPTFEVIALAGARGTGVYNNIQPVTVFLRPEVEACNIYISHRIHVCYIW